MVYFLIWLHVFFLSIFFRLSFCLFVLLCFKLNKIIKYYKVGNYRVNSQPEDRPSCAVLTVVIRLMSYEQNTSLYNLARRTPPLFHRPLPNLVNIQANNQ